jgi:tetratricopeptide (TPR) repeat protein
MLRLRLSPALVVVCVLGASFVSREARAQAHEPPSEAMTLFESAREHYRAGEYAAAATDLENALVLDPAAPTLLFNLGRVYELQGDYTRSISAYRRLLAVTPPDQVEERERTQSTIDRLEGAAQHDEPPPPAQETGDDDRGPTFVRERGVADDLFWGTFAASGVIGLAAIGCGIASLALFDSGASYTLYVPGDDVQRAHLLDQSASTGVAADVLGSISLAGFAASLLLFVLREHTYESWDVHAGRSGLELAFHWDGGAF